MKYILSIACLLLIGSVLTGQSKSQLEKERNRLLEEISYVDNMLKSTAAKKSAGLNELNVLSRKVTFRENVIRGYKEEISILEQRIAINRLAISLMEDDLKTLKKEYAYSITNSYKQAKGYPDIAFLLSARDINQGYKRLKYLQQFASYRRREAETIIAVKEVIGESEKRLVSDLASLADLKKNEERERGNLVQEQNRTRGMVTSLSKKEKDLRRELEDKKKISKRIETEINRIIEEERKKLATGDLAPEMKLIGNDFLTNKGRLPWPVDKGIITAQFGTHRHPVLTNLTVDNIGIEITSSGKTVAQAVFKGKVERVIGIQGGNMAIIIRHGKYLTVYQNIVNTRVKPGDNVETKQILGDVYAEPDSGNRAVIKFMIFEEKSKLNPEDWIAKK